MKLLIGADLVPTKSNQDLFSKADATALVGGDLLAILQDADYRIFNLEMPLTDTATPILKNGPALIAPTSAIAGYQALGVDLVTIANNHIMDQDVQGLSSTVDLLEKNQIACLGGGMDLAAAQKPYIFTCDGKKIGVYACAEHEFSIAKADVPGANPFDPLESPDHVASLKAQCDYVIVLYHGGKEHYRYPSPNLRKVCRKLVEKGADLVLCQHSHCIGCEEKYLDGTIVYGQGNFLFDSCNVECWQTSLLVQVDDDFSVSYLPLAKKGNTVRLATGAEGTEILTAFYERSKEITNSSVVDKKYAELATDMQETYLLALAAVNPRALWMRVLNRLTGQRFTKWMLSLRYGKRKLLRILNVIECEAHNELLCQGIKDMLD